MDSIDSDRLCLQCRHYYITHDAQLPYGCRALNFKSRRRPCREVLAASGEACQFFAEKPPRAEDKLQR